MLLLNGMAAPLRREGVIRLYELCREEETQMDRNQQIAIRNLKAAAFPASYCAACFNRWISPIKCAFNII